MGLGCDVTIDGFCSSLNLQHRQYAYIEWVRVRVNHSRSPGEMRAQDTKVPDAYQLLSRWWK